MDKCKKPIENVNIIAQLADMKTIDYNNLLSIIVIYELLVEKEIISREEFKNKFIELDRL